jgi:hypothetical protein
MTVPEGSAIDFGAVIDGIDIENLTGRFFSNQRDMVIS